MTRTVSSTVSDPVFAAVARSAAARPGRLAVADGQQTLTYGELWQRALRLAGALREAGVVAGDLVGLCVPRSADLAVGALGITVAGAAYVALDPASPPERLSFMLADCAARLAVSSSDLPGVRVLDPDQDAECVEPEPGELAYVVYTSGSTGRPKGVLVDQEALANLVRWHCSAFQLGESDRVSLIASPGFDASVWELWPALAAGAALVVVPEDVKLEPARLRNWLVDQRITVGFLPTPLAEAVLALDWPADTALRYLLTGGDALHVRARPGTAFTLVNNYGVSEAAVVSTSGAVAPGAGVPPIGAPIANVDLLVVDAAMRPTDVGELVIRGVSLARGYLGAAADTGRFCIVDGGRAYRTGDLVRRRPDGQFDYLGRLDDQVQIRGVRVEPGEVSAVLAQHPAVCAAAVVPVDEGLVGFAVFNGDERDADLRAFLKQRLPAQMVPSQVVAVPAIPTTLNGKVDRDALLAQLEPVSAAGTEPRTELQEAIAAIVAGLLNRADVGVEENFFLLGGHSLLGAQLIARISADFGVDMSLRALFDHPTVAGIAEQVEELLLADLAE